MHRDSDINSFFSFNKPEPKIADGIEKTKEKENILIPLCVSPYKGENFSAS
jgi:hypothetical protein